MSMAAEASTRGRVALSARRTQRAGRLYGQFVGFMKVVLPTIATALLLIVVIWPQLNEQRDKFEIGIVKL